MPVSLTGRETREAQPYDTRRRPFNSNAPPFRHLHVGAPVQDGVPRQRVPQAQERLTVLHQARVPVRLWRDIASGARSNVAGDIAPIGVLGHQALVAPSHQDALARTVARRGMENDIGVVGYAVEGDPRTVGRPCGPAPSPHGTAPR